MPIDDTLGKIIERHPDVIGAIVKSEDRVFHNLEPPYDVISVDEIMTMLEEIFEHASMLEDEGHVFTDLMLDFETHSFIVRSLDTGLLVVLAPRLQRGQLVKLHVGLGLFAKAVQKALDSEAASTPVTKPAQSEKVAPVTEPVVLAEPVQSVSEMAAEPEDGTWLSPRIGRSRGRIKNAANIISARHSVEGAVNEPQPKQPKVDADGVPLNADGTPKKRKVYRGQVYYE